MRRIVLGVAALGLAACAPGQFDKSVARFEEKAGPILARGCDTFRKADASPLVQAAIAIGSTAATAASGVPVGAAVASLREFGREFCANGPPVGDPTTEAQRAVWLADITAKLQAAAQRTLK